jgi:hypothetical protein
MNIVSVKEELDVNKFLEYIANILRIAIYINRTTDELAVLQKCVDMYETVVSIIKQKELTDESKLYITKLVKRCNIILKTQDSKPLNIQDKNIQRNIMEYAPNTSIELDSLKSFKVYIEKNYEDGAINLFPEIPLKFILYANKKCDHLGRLNWQYMRCAFYISQIILAKDKDIELVEATVDYITEILEEIEKLDKHYDITKELNNDEFLKAKISRLSVDEDDLDEASENVKKMLTDKLGEDNILVEIIGRITEGMRDSEFEEGNMMQNMFSIAQTVCSEFRHRFEEQPDILQQSVVTVQGIFKEHVTSESDFGQMPPIIKQMLDGNINDDEDKVQTYIQEYMEANDIDYNTALTDESYKEELEEYINFRMTEDVKLLGK